MPYIHKMNVPSSLHYHLDLVCVIDQWSLLMLWAQSHSQASAEFHGNFVVEGSHKKLWTYLNTDALLLPMEAKQHEFAEIWWIFPHLKKKSCASSVFVTLRSLISKPQNCGKMCVVMAAWCEDGGKCEGRKFGMSQRNPVIIGWLNLLQKTKFFFMNLCWYFFLVNSDSLCVEMEVPANAPCDSHRFTLVVGVFKLIEINYFIFNLFFWSWGEISEINEMPACEYELLLRKREVSRVFF